MGKAKTKPVGQFVPGEDYVMISTRDGKLINVLSRLACEHDGDILGGFHTLCADVGEIPGHPLSGFKAGDVLPLSLWNRNHRAECGNDGMVYEPGNDIWVDIYLCRDEAGKLLNLSYDDFVALGDRQKKRLMTDAEFSTAADGSNEMTNIAKSKRPDSSGGHVDQMGRRMISHIGCEDMCGVLWHWLSTPWPVDRDYQLLAGGAWSSGTSSGSRSRYAYNFRWYTATYFGARFAAEPVNKRGASRRQTDRA